MKSLKCGLVLCCLVFGICKADTPPSTITIPVSTSPVNPIKNSTTIAPTTQNPNATTTTPTNTSSSTITPTTQNPNATTTTSSTSTTPTTTTITPETSTSTTTPKPTTSTTTSKPNTTTTSTTTPAPPPAPTPAPTPLPPATQGVWNYTESNITCIMVQFAGRLNVSYHMNNSGMAHVLLNIPANATVTNGSCTSPQFLVISWGNNSMWLQWTRNVTTTQYRLSTLDVTLERDHEHFPNSSESSPLSLHLSRSEWEVASGVSYRCDSPLSLNLTEDSGAVATLTVDRLWEEAYHNDTHTGFSTARTCEGPDLPDVVPVVVGCVLAGLVLVVLGAYLVARRRSTQGYLSM